jgi:hypothetical protein
MSATTIDVTTWHPERIAGFLEAIRGDHPSVEIECIVRHHDTDRIGQMSMSLSHDEPSDLVARECQQCRTTTVAKVLPLDGLLAPKTLAEEIDDDPEPTHLNGDTPDKPDTPRGNRWD